MGGNARKERQASRGGNSPALCVCVCMCLYVCVSVCVYLATYRNHRQGGSSPRRSPAGKSEANRSFHATISQKDPPPAVSRGMAEQQGANSPVKLQDLFAPAEKVLLGPKFQGKVRGFEAGPTPLPIFSFTWVAGFSCIFPSP